MEIGNVAACHEPGRAFSHPSTLLALAPLSLSLFLAELWPQCSSYVLFHKINNKLNSLGVYYYPKILSSTVVEEQTTNIDLYRSVSLFISRSQVHIIVLIMQNDYQWHCIVNRESVKLTSRDRLNTLSIISVGNSAKLNDEKFSFEWKLMRMLENCEIANWFDCVHFILLDAIMRKITEIHYKIIFTT